MPATTRYKRGDIVLVPFPFTDLSSAKRRPALVVSPDSFNSTRDDLLLAAISSQIPARLAPDEYLIPTNDLAASGLPKDSIIKVAKLISIHRSLIVKRLGTFPEGSLASVLAMIRNLF